jgi:hypothetical protein
LNGTFAKRATFRKSLMYISVYVRVTKIPEPLDSPPPSYSPLFLFLLEFPKLNFYPIGL